MKSPTFLFLLAALTLGAPPAVSESDKNVVGSLSSAGRRFVLGQISDFRRDRFLLDTETGRLWVLVDDEGSPALQAVPYLTLDGSRSLVPLPAASEVDALHAPRPKKVTPPATK